MAKRQKPEQMGGEDDRWAEWLGLHGGAKVTGVRGDRGWNRNVALGATEKALGMEPGTYRPKEER